jgi:prepilin-type N-terminal cleavage/methylation domain-containing protein
MQLLARHRARGVTLIEVMVVVVILGLIASAVAIGVFAQHRKVQLQITHVAAATMRTAASAWRMENPGDVCPTPERLRDDQLVDSGSKLTDAWGTPFRIVCRDRETIVISLGPDRKESDDDLVEPEPAAIVARQ